MPENGCTPLLYLLTPGELPIQETLSENSKSQLGKALNLLLQALEQPAHQEAIASVNKALATLGDLNVLIAKVSSTNTTLKASDIEDYNKYFDVRHVQAQNPAACVVSSLLVACQIFLELNCQPVLLDPTQVELQKQGFKSYAHLLARVFNLSLESI